MKAYKCKRCGHKWYPRTPKRPRRCPEDGCKSTYWDLTRRPVKKKTPSKTRRKKAVKS